MSGTSAAGRPIDWHCDRRSGYRFPGDPLVTVHSTRPAPGVDIKVPWELSRMHHVVQLALLAVDESASPEMAKACATEIEDEIRISSRRIHHVSASTGVSRWMSRSVPPSSPLRCSMPAGAIRHGCVTCWAAVCGPWAFHHRHLEWDPDVRGNHYLANVCGLAFIAALPADTETDAWLASMRGEALAEASARSTTMAAASRRRCRTIGFRSRC